jgi:hypothetical protein
MAKTIVPSVKSIAEAMQRPIEPVHVNLGTTEDMQKFVTNQPQQLPPPTGYEKESKYDKTRLDLVPGKLRKTL